MNIFSLYLKKLIKIINLANKQKNLNLPEKLNAIKVDVPPIEFNCDISTNLAMILSKPNNKSPLEIADTLANLIKKDNDDIDELSIVKPGFINIKFTQTFWNNFIKNVILNISDFGINNDDIKKNFLIEFVSANPTGPLHVGHCRGAILGDALSNLLIFNKHSVTKEYYVNDYGNQILQFSRSVYLRAREILFKEVYPSDDQNLYPGLYVIDIAKNIIKNNKKLKFENFNKISNELTKLAVTESLKSIKFNLKNLGVIHDNYAKESDIVKNNEVQKVIEKLKVKNYIYEGTIKAPEGEDKKSKWKIRNQLLFKSSNFGDDKDRPLQKEDETWTYFASDVAYHNTKLNKNYDTLINILGSDHAGYIKRITSAVQALSGEKDKLVCKVSQLVKLIKDGKPFKMSKRKGDYITVEDLVNEVGKDATRFIMLNRSSDVELDFDFTKVKEKSKDNPLYYVQYCYARISSVFRNANLEQDNDLKISKYNFIFNKDEKKILKKISEWPKCIEITTYKLEPHRIPVYLYELSSLFHSYWNLGKNNENYKFIDKNKKINESKLVLLKLIMHVLKTGMNIIGASTPNKM